MNIVDRTPNIHFGVAALATAALLLESTLTRLLAVAQYYHFAFLVVSLALLGFGASGTLLSVMPRLGRISTHVLLAWSGLAFAASTALAYAVVNLLPFDSYSIAWDRRQILYFVFYYLALTLPFLCAGLGIAGALAASPGRSHVVYAANLLGSAAGVVLAPALMWMAGVPGAVLASTLIALLPAVGAQPFKRRRKKEEGKSSFLGGHAGPPLLLAGVVALGVLTSFNLSGRGLLGLTLSPYKGLSHARRYPGSVQLLGRWDAVSRVDVLENAGTRLLPGLSYTYSGAAPRQLGLSVDGDSVLPLPLDQPDDFEAAGYMPEAAAFILRPGAKTLVLEPGAGLGILQALAGGAGEITAVTGNSLLRQAVMLANQEAGLDGDERGPQGRFPVDTLVEAPRVYLRREGPAYDVIFMPLTDAYRPVASGAYSLAETYTLTVESFAAALARLEPGGVLVVSRWLQVPPSEDLRLVATLIEALERRGIGDPGNALVAYRGIQTLTALVNPSGWSAEELATVREFAEARRYDLVWAPDVVPEEVNRYNRMSTPEHYNAVKALLESADARSRRSFYQDYPFAIAPATDDRPFFFHFFRWTQTPAVLATLGRTWQPFGGSGYLILFALLALVLVLSAVLILLPPALYSTDLTGFENLSGLSSARIVGYFGLLGIAFLCIEIPLIQRWLLAFGHATYAFTAVVLIVLVGSSLGSLASRLRSSRTVLLALAALALVTALAGGWLVELTLGWSAPLRLAVLALSLAPLAIMMGMPFPLGLAWLERNAPDRAAWAWAVNGCASVIASVVAAILALSYGFTAVLLLGALCYGLAAFIIQTRPAQT